LQVDVDGVEEVLRGYPGVKTCACVARPLSHLNCGEDTPREALVAFVVPKVMRRDGADEALSVEETEAEAIEAYLADRLPRWSVPARVVFIASIALTAALASSAPKCDRRALARMPMPLPRRTRARRDGEGREAEREEVDGTVVAHVAKLAADVLGVDASSVDGDDSFAQLGGASLEAQRLLYALRSAALGTLNYVGGWDRMTPADIIAADTPRRIAAAAMNGSPSDGTGGALTTAGMFTEAAREAKEIGVGMWDARGVWKRLEASGSDKVVKGVKPSETVLSLGRAKGVFLTGATGLLGRFLMHEILARIAPNAVLFCLVRGASAGTARARLEEKAFPSKPLDSRVRVIAGDATHRKFGLSDEEHKRLAASIDVVVHSAGVVSAAAPYASMASGNVAPAREVLRLACLRPGAIVVHHVSSSAVLPPLGTPAAEVADSCATWSESATGGGEALASLAAAGGYDTAEVHGGTWQGYAQAKWVTEMLVWATAKSCGVPVCVYRPGNIGPRSFDGVGCEGDGTMALALATCVGGWTSDMRIGERWRLWWTPADAVARAIATVAAIENGDVWANRALHVDPVEPLPASALMNRMKVRMNAGVWKRLEASGSDDDGREGGGDGDDDDDVSAWRRAVLAGLHALPPTLTRKVESLLALKSGLLGAMGAAERRMDGTELRAILQTEEGGDGFMDACEEVLGRYVDAFAEHVRGER
jgi:thioester reductase-like protein